MNTGEVDRDEFCKKVAKFYGSDSKKRIELKTKLYHNLGFWRSGASTIDQAGEDLLAYLLQLCDLNDPKSILDVGCGFGESLSYLNAKYPNASLCGIDISNELLQISRDFVASKSKDRIEVSKMDATKLSYDDNSFDLIIAMDCALHFNTREHFLEQAFRVLKPGGSLIISDICVNSKTVSWGKRMIGELLLKFWMVPSENVISFKDYSRVLKKYGFCEIHRESIRDDVFPMAVKYTLSNHFRSMYRELFGYKKTFFRMSIFRLMGMMYKEGYLDYGIFQIVKPIESQLD